MMQPLFPCTITFQNRRLKSSLKELPPPPDNAAFESAVVYRV
jgi:hypothetical protein